MSERRKVVIVGGGFGGVAAAKHLNRPDLEVTIVDPRNHQLFQPLIYQVAAGGLSAGQVASPIRELVRRQPNATVLMEQVTDIDPGSRQVVLERGDRLDYDHLIVACGGETSYFGHDEWADVACSLKSLDDAVDLRDRIFGAFEEAELAPDDAAREEWLRFVVVGGGPTGVEISGQLAILTRHTMKRDFRRFSPTKAEVILLDAGQRVVSAFHEVTSKRAARGLAKLGVVVREGARVTEVDPHGVTVQIDGRTERIASRTVIWAAGVRAVGLTTVLARATGAETDRAGRIRVNSACSVPNHPEISVIGDAASLDGENGKPLPGLATVSIQQARHVAAGIRHGAPGAQGPYKYFDKGALAVIGRGKAVCEVRGLKLSGRIAFAMYLTVHLYYLAGVGGRRVSVIVSWVGARLGAAENRVILGRLQRIERPEEPAPARAPAEQAAAASEA